MTMTRTEKASHLPFTSGAQAHPISSPTLIARYGSRVFTPAQYAAHWMGRGTVDAETARCRKLEKAGWVYLDGTGRYRKTIRKG
jgi:hypothetical protein